MGHHFQTDEPRVLFYLDENEGWLKILSSQAGEIPHLENLLSQTPTGPDKENAIKHFKSALQNQQQLTSALNAALQLQQQRLEADAAEKKYYDIKVICSQDILRDQIKEVEKKYVDLKCNFMQFMSGII